MLHDWLDMESLSDPEVLTREIFEQHWSKVLVFDFCFYPVDFELDYGEYNTEKRVVLYDDLVTFFARRPHTDHYEEDAFAYCRLPDQRCVYGQECL